MLTFILIGDSETGLLSSYTWTESDCTPVHGEFIYGSALCTESHNLITSCADAISQSVEDVIANHQSCRSPACSVAELRFKVMYWTHIGQVSDFYFFGFWTVGDKQCSKKNQRKVPDRKKTQRKVTDLSSPKKGPGPPYLRIEPKTSCSCCEVELLAAHVPLCLSIRKTWLSMIVWKALY